MTNSDASEGEKTDPEFQLVRRSSFKIGNLDDWAVTDDAVALLSGSTVSLVSTDRDEIILEEPGQNVAINDHLFVLFDGELAAYGRSGTRLWVADVPGAERIAAPDETEFVVVLTDDDRIVGIDATTGGIRFEQDRPDADVAATPELVSTTSDLVLASWSFLTVLEPDGETRMRTNLDGAISDLGVVDDVVVCVMKDDRCVGVDLASGDQLWEHDWAVDRIDPHGSGELFVQTTDSVRAVEPSGDWRSLSLQGGMPVAAVSGKVVCSVDGSVVNVFEAVDPSQVEIDAAVGADEISVTAQSLPVVIENVGETVATVRVAVEIEGATTITGEERLSLDPGENEGLRVGLGSISRDQLDVRVQIDGELVLNDTVDVLGGVDAVETSATPVHADDGWNVSLELRNPEPVPLHDIRIEPSGRTIPTLESGESCSMEVDLPESRRIRIRAAGETQKIDMAVPERPIAVNAAVNDGLVVVSLWNDGDVSVDDEISVTSSALPQPLTVPIDADVPRTVVAFPPGESGSVTVRADGEFLDHETTVEVPDEAVLHGRDAAPDRPVRSQGSVVDATAAAGGGPSRRSGNSGGPDPDAASDDRLELSREFEPEQPLVGSLVFEYVEVTNASSDTVSVGVHPTDDDETVGSVPAGETRRFVRVHTFTDCEATVPAVSVETSAGRRDAGEHPMRIDRPEAYCFASGHPRQDALRLHAVNNSQSRTTISDLSLRNGTLLDAPAEMQVAPRSEKTETISTDELDPSTEAELLSFSIAPDVVDDVDRDHRQTLVHVEGGEVSGIEDLTLEIDDETVVDDGSGTVVVTVMNDGPDPIDGISIEAGGEQLRPILYDPLEDMSLDPGETTSHYVDVEGVADRVKVPLTLAVDGDETRAEVVGDPSNVGALAIERESTDSVGFPLRISSPVELVPDQ
ncbi:hypothetical protein JCM17823_07100 [Halorubrum gandharaense]